MTFEDTFKEFKIMRNKIKKPMTRRAEELMLKRLNNLSKDEKEQIAILEQSIMFSWQGIYSLTNGNKIRGFKNL
jgi:hypothetical protein